MKKNKLLLMSFVFGLTSVISPLSNVTFAGLNGDNLSHLVYNEDNGLITVYSEGFSYGVTLQDKDLGANSAGETGNYYQYGNNNPWDYYDEEIRDQWANYTFNNYYQNWGGQIDNIETDGVVKGYDIVNHVSTDVEDRQGPCESGYHVPSAGEWNELLKLWCAQEEGCSLGVYDNVGWPAEMNWASYIYNGSGEVSSKFINDMKFVAGGFMYNYTKSTYGGSSWLAGQIGDSGKFGNYWASSVFPLSNSEGWSNYAWRTNLAFGDIGAGQDGALGMVSPAGYTAGNWGELVRCFKNSYVHNLVLNYDNEGAEIVKMVSFEEGENPTISEINDAIDEINDDINLEEGQHIAWYIVNENNERIPFDLVNENISGTMYLFGEKEINRYTVSFLDIDSSELLPVQIFEYDEEKALTVFDGSKDGYEFEGWKDIDGNLYKNGEIVKNLSINDGVKIVLTAQWKRIGGYSGGGRGSNSNLISLDNEQKQELEDKELVNEVSNEVIKNNDVNSFDTVDFENNGDYTQESIAAYEWAYKNGLTQYGIITEARLKDSLSRAEMAKIVSAFALNVLSKVSDEQKQKICSEFSDLGIVDENMRYFVVNSCKLSYMGYQSNGIDLLDKFRPDNYLTLAEASAIISRILWGNTYSLEEELWYVGHLRAVYENALLDDILSPERNITREEAFIMLYRLYNMVK